jgi:hypothetical protein
VKSRNINRNVNSSTGSNFNGDDVNRTIVLPILKCLYTNADQFTNKITELIVRARDKKLDIIEITEVKPKNSRYKPHLAEYSLTEVGNYKMFGKNLEKDNGRGQ